MMLSFVDKLSFGSDKKNYSSPTMARCSAAKATGNPKTDFMAQGMSEDKPMGQVEYGV